MKKFLSFLAAATMMSFGIANAQERFVSENAQNRKALLEEYTGFHCGNCPDGHKRANDLHEKYPNDLFLINVHAGSLAIPGSNEIDLRTSYGDDLFKNAGVSGIPTGSINRHIFSGASTTTDRTTWASNISKILMMSSPVNIAAKGTLDWENRELKVTVQLYYTDNSKAASNYIQLAITQDHIIGTQDGASINPAQVLPDGKYIHNHVLRDLVTGQWGDEVTTTNKGSFVEKIYTKTLPEAVRNIQLKMSNLHFIAFVTENRNEVLNVCNVEIEHTNAPSHYVKLSAMKQTLDNVCDNSIRFTFKLETTIASEPITSIVFNYETPAGSKEFEYKPEEALLADKTYFLETAPIAVTQQGVNQHVSMKITKINGQDYTQEQDNLVEADGIKRFALSSTPNINVNIWQDKYGSDITWQLKKIDGDILASGGPYSDLGSNRAELRTTQVSLADGCYAFTIYDKGNDGINNGSGEGHLSITDANGNDIMTHDGKYTDSLRYLIGYGNVGNRKAQTVHHALLAPNPADEYSVLSFELPSTQEVRVRVIANNGTCALDLGNMNLTAGKQNIQLPLNKLAEGLYIVQVFGQNLNLTQKLMIVR